MHWWFTGADEQDPGDQRDIRNVEYARAKRTNPDAHEVDDSTADDPVNQIRCAAGYKQHCANEGYTAPPELVGSKGNDQNTNSGTDRQHTGTSPIRKLRAQTQKRPRILNIFEPEYTSEVRSAICAGQCGCSNML